MYIYTHTYIYTHIYMNTYTHILNSKILHPQILPLNLPCPKMSEKLKSVLIRVVQALLRIFKPQGAMVFKVWIQ